jgi:Flp pilus assembly protein CpaB
LATAAPSRPRAGGGRFFIIIGLILALVAGLGVFLLTTLLGGGSAITGGSRQTVVYATQAIPLRHQITSADLATEDVSSNVAVNTYTKTTDITSQGYIAEIQISKGSIITGDMLAKDINLIPAGAAPAYLPLASGFVAMTIPTGELQGVAGHITLGDYITVIASGGIAVFASSGAQVGPTKVVSKTVFTNVRIIGLGPSTPNVQPANGATSVSGTTVASGLTSSLTIELTQCNAEYFTWFLNNMQLKYTLESFKDYLTAPTQPDPNCKDILQAGGVTQTQVDAKYHFTSL